MTVFDVFCAIGIAVVVIGVAWMIVWVIAWMGVIADASEAIIEYLKKGGVK